MDRTSELTPHPASPDLDQLPLDKCQPRTFPVAERRGSSVQIVVRQSVLNEIHRHGKSTIEVEVCGVLVGNTYSDEVGAFVHVTASIRGAHAQNLNAQVTFTAETWQHIQAELDREHAGLRILGWYHTHPGFGIFLSSMDRFIHDNFFNDHEQLALVYDPVYHEQGLFVWRAGVPVAEPCLVEADVPPTESDLGWIVSALSVPRTNLTAAADSGNGLADLLARVEQLECRQRMLFGGLILVMLVALAWPMSIAIGQLRRQPVLESSVKSTTDRAATALQPGSKSAPRRSKESSQVQSAGRLRHAG